MKPETLAQRQGACAGPAGGIGRDLVADIARSREAASGRHSNQFVTDWVAARRAESRLRVTPAPLGRLSGWKIDPGSGNIQHQTGRFFTVTGLSIRHRTKTGELFWDQPIIDQPEVGILGIVAKKIDGVLHFCLQAKEEPGNIGAVQLSPTVQATYSNYTQAHGGSRPPFVEYFLDPPRERLIFAKLQTEDGGRFLYKSNRNMIVSVGADELTQVPQDFIWLTLGQIAGLIRCDNLVHATTRSVLSSLIGSSCPHGESFARPLPTRLYETLQWLDDQRASNHFLVKRSGLNTLQEWEMDEAGFFSHREGRFFRVMGIRMTSAAREVSGWEQPILVNPEIGTIGLLAKEEMGERFFLMQAKAEPGNRTVVQLGPTVQFTPGNYLGNEKLAKPFLFDEFTGPGRMGVMAESLQAEEGARFFKETHRHLILHLPEGESLDHPPEYRWVAEAELSFFMTLGEQVNSCARSIISCLL